MTPKPLPEEERAGAYLLQAARKINVKADEKQLKLPADYTFPRSALSPGKVIFSHKRHVSMGTEACTNCHPKTYPMLSPGPSDKSFHTEKMYGCSVCHDGVRTFSTDSECKLCHGQKPSGKPAVPDDFLIPSGSNGVGPVRITHAKHMAVSGSKCLDCHPRPFLMTKPGSTFGKIKDFTKRMAEGHQCARCHNGKAAFAMYADCTRCHVSIGRKRAEALAPRGL